MQMNEKDAETFRRLQQQNLIRRPSANGIPPDSTLQKGLNRLL
jgi:hypothetical protein